jgi:hypothetical protein
VRVALVLDVVLQRLVQVLAQLRQVLVQEDVVQLRVRVQEVQSRHRNHGQR